MQTAEEFLASVGDTTNESVDMMAQDGRYVDIMDNEYLRIGLDQLYPEDYDPDRNRHNENQASGLHPHYGGFDNPEDIDDEDY